jgi:DNA-binding NarL/FixJ family response regulator
MTTVAIVDDHPVFRDGLRAVLATITGTETLWEAGTAAEALRLAQQAPPDIVLMDLHMPGMSGIDATRQLTAAHAGLRVLVLTMLEDESSLLAAVRAGAHGYLVKGADRAEIERALSAVSHGEAVFGPQVARRLLDAFALGGGRAPAPFPELTEREREVLGLLAAGLDNRTIARRLHLGEKTVRNYVSNILTKLHVASRYDAADLAREAGVHERTDPSNSTPTRAAEVPRSRWTDQGSHPHDQYGGGTGRR